MIVVLSLCVFFDIFSVKALSNIDHVSKLFEEVIIKCFNDEENVLVYDGEGRQTESIVHQRRFPRLVAGIHTADLRNSLMLSLIHI